MWQQWATSETKSSLRPKRHTISWVTRAYSTLRRPVSIPPWSGHPSGESQKPRWSHVHLADPTLCRSDPCKRNEMFGQLKCVALLLSAMTMAPGPEWQQRFPPFSPGCACQSHASHPLPRCGVLKSHRPNGIYGLCSCSMASTLLRGRTLKAGTLLFAYRVCCHGTLNGQTTTQPSVPTPRPPRPLTSTRTGWSFNRVPFQCLRRNLCNVSTKVNRNSLSLTQHKYV